MTTLEQFLLNLAASSAAGLVLAIVAWLIARRFLQITIDLHLGTGTNENDEDEGS